MSWRSDFGEHWDVPRPILFMVAAGLVRDLSYGNDSMPSFGYYDESTDANLAIYCDHPLVSHREDKVMARFIVQAVNAPVAFVKPTDDLEAAIKIYFRHLPKVAGSELTMHLKGHSPDYVLPDDCDEFLSDLFDLYLHWKG